MAATTKSTATGKFNYVAVDPNGDRAKGSMRGSSAAAVTTALLNDGWTPISVKKVAGGNGLSIDVGAMIGGYKMKPAAMAEFSRQLHQMLRAGLTVPRAMETIAEQSDPTLADICMDITNQVSAGLPFAQALQAHPDQFDDVFCAYITAGEQGGTLVETTGRLTKMLEKQAQLERKVNAVTIYPKIVSSVIFVLVCGILIFLVPKFASIYASFHSELPGPTLALIALSRIATPIKIWHPEVAQSIPIMHGLPVPNLISPIFAIIVAVAIFLYWKKQTMENLAIGERLDRIRFRIPLLGPLGKKMSLYRWSSTLAGAIQSGLQPFISLDLAARASGSRWYRHITPDLQDAVQTGRSLGGALRAHADLFPPNVRSMIETGEHTGDVTSMLDSVTVALEDDIDTMVAGLGAKLEVALLLIMGTTVGSLLVVLYLPILNLSTAASHAAG
jgi:type IV pilus assembly protein PilC